MKNRFHVVAVLAISTAALALTGCGGGGGGGDDPLLPSTDATLSALGFSSGTLEPTFDPGTTEYTLAVGLFVPTTTVTPTATDAGASITADGTSVLSGAASPGIALAIGPTPVLIDVTAADGTTQATYTVVITRAAAAMQEGGYLKASNAEAFDKFGISVAISGDTLVVGAYREDGNATSGEADNSTTDAGAAYVYTRTGSTWTQQQVIKASNAEPAEEFGESVSISGDTLVVGADNEDSNATSGEADNSATSAGAAYVSR